MPDLEKVIKGLENLSEWLFLQYQVVYDGDAPNYYDAYKTVDEALALLKDREPLAVDEGKVNKCVCGNEINRYWHPEYCGFCGKKLEWY